MAKIAQFNKPQLSWVVLIQKGRKANCSFSMGEHGCVTVMIECSSWDQVEGLRRLAEDEIRKRDFLRAKSDFM